MEGEVDGLIQRAALELVDADIVCFHFGAVRPGAWTLVWPAS
jgi:hypothetical protein